MYQIDLNSDLGESFGRYTIGNDDKIIPLITSANVACGYHASDPVVMMETIQRAKEAGIAVGAHPGLPDLMGFGRRSMAISNEEAKAYTLYQISAIGGMCKAAGVKLQHVKPHGALYNMAAINRVIRMIKEGKVTSITGKDIDIKADSVCVHGDGEKALLFVEKIRKTFGENEIEICHL